MQSSRRGEADQSAAFAAGLCAVRVGPPEKSELEKKIVLRTFGI